MGFKHTCYDVSILTAVYSLIESFASSSKLYACKPFINKDFNLLNSWYLVGNYVILYDI